MTANHGRIGHFVPRIPLTQFSFEDFVEFVPGLTLDPGAVPAVLKQDKSKILQDGCQRRSHPFRRMGVVVAVDRHHRALDVQENYYVCTDCAKLYWRGTHYPKLQEMVERILEESK